MQAAWLPNLTMLDISYNDFEGWHFRLLNEGNLTILSSLIMDGSNLHGESMRAFAKGNWRGLKRLSAQNSRISFDGLQALVRMDLPLLENLNLAHNAINSNLLAVLRLGNWPTLITIDISSNAIDAKAVAFLEDTVWPLQVLVLNGNRLNAKVLFQLKRVELQLKALHLCNTSITPAGLRKLAAGSMWNQLEVLDFSNNNASLPEQLCRVFNPSQEQSLLTRYMQSF